MGVILTTYIHWEVSYMLGGAGFLNHQQYGLEIAGNKSNTLEV